MSSTIGVYSTPLPVSHGDHLDSIPWDYTNWKFASPRNSELISSPTRRESTTTFYRSMPMSCANWHDTSVKSDIRPKLKWCMKGKERSYLKKFPYNRLSKEWSYIYIYILILMIVQISHFTMFRNVSTWILSARFFLGSIELKNKAYAPEAARER